MTKREALGVFAEFMVDVVIPATKKEESFSLTKEFTESREVLRKHGIDWRDLGYGIEQALKEK